MKHRKMKQLLLLLLAACLLSSCQIMPSGLQRVTSTEVSGEESNLPSAVNTSVKRVKEQATLWFRYTTEDLLAPESRTVTRSMDESYEMALIRALLAGPELRSTSLSALFPAGTSVIETSTNGRTLYVTFSAELMNGYTDEPEDWESDSYWSRETPVRRRLCMQSLVATITENCDIDRVQVLVEEEDGSRTRLPMAYYPEASGETLPAEPLWRDDSLLLTPGSTATIILNALKTRDWTRLYRFVAQTEESESASDITYEDFVREMERLPMLLSWDLGEGSVSEGVVRMTYPIDLTVLQNGHTEQFESRVLRLNRTDSIWMITVTQLQQLLEVRDE